MGSDHIRKQLEEIQTRSKRDTVKRRKLAKEKHIAWSQGWNSSGSESSESDLSGSPSSSTSGTSNGPQVCADESSEKLKREMAEIQKDVDRTPRWKKTLAPKGPYCTAPPSFSTEFSC